MVSCDRVVALGPGGHKDLLVFNVGLEGDLERVVGNVQLKIDPQEVPITLTVDKGGTSAVGWSAFLRHGAPVEHEALEVAGLGLTAAVPRIYDERIDGERSGTVATFQPAEGPVYVMLASRNLDLQPLEMVTISLGADAVAEVGEPSPGRAEPKPLQREAACSTGWAGGSGGMALVGIVLQACARRRP